MQLDKMYAEINDHLKGTKILNEDVKVEFKQMSPSAPLSTMNRLGDTAVITFNLDSHML